MALLFDESVGRDPNPLVITWDMETWKLDPRHGSHSASASRTYGALAPRTHGASALDS